MNEIWKPISGYEGRYEISNMGRVRTIAQQNRWGETLYPLSTPIYNKASRVNGHLTVVLTKNKVRKTHLVHRLVALAFIPNPYNLPIVNHKDENPENNAVSNLEWCTRKYNNSYGTVRERQKVSHINHPLLSTPVICLKNGIVLTEYPSMKEAERQTGCHQTHIMACCQGKRKTTGGFEWQYKIGRKKPLVTN